MPSCVFFPLLFLSGVVGFGLTMFGRRGEEGDIVGVNMSGLIWVAGCYVGFPAFIVTLPRVA